MKEYRFYFKYDYGKGNTEERAEDVIITNITNPDKYGRQRAKDIVYGKKGQWKLYGNEYKRKFFDCVFLRSVFLRNIEKNEGAKMDFDYYQIKGKWNAATLNRRAEKLDEAQAAADELEAAGAKSVEIIGVKAGRRETIRGKKNAAAKKTAVKMTGTTGEYITDYKTHEKAAAAAKNIEKLGFDVELVKPAKKNKAVFKPKKKKKATKPAKTKKKAKKIPNTVKRIYEAENNLKKYRVKDIDDKDFGIDSWDKYDYRKNEKFTFEFNQEELSFITNALDRAGEDVGFKYGKNGQYSKHENLETTISNLNYEGKPATIELDGEEMAIITRALDNLINIQKSSFYKSALDSLLLSLSV